MVDATILIKEKNDETPKLVALEIKSGKPKLSHVNQVRKFIFIKTSNRFTSIAFYCLRDSLIVEIQTSYYT